jgi:ADP-ribose pyrophosphatase YjhB (NUDIX family)
VPAEPRDVIGSPLAHRGTSADTLAAVETPAVKPPAPDPPSHPNHVFRHCPRCGAAGLTPQGNSLRCAACSLAWYYNAACAVDVILEKPGGHILLTRRARDPRKGFWDLPGGFVSPDERAEDAARREVKEEVGIDVGELTWFGSFPNRYEYGGLLYFACDLIFRSPVDETQLVVGDDVSDARFVDPFAIDPGEIGLESTRAAFTAYLSFRRTRR